MASTRTFALKLMPREAGWPVGSPNGERRFVIGTIECGQEIIMGKKSCCVITLPLWLHWFCKVRCSLGHLHAALPTRHFSAGLPHTKYLSTY